MKFVNTALLAGVAIAFGTSPALAQASMAPDAKMAGPASTQMSEADKKAWTQCKVMTNEAMMKNADCARIMKAHPHAMKDGSMKSGTAKPDMTKADPASK